MYSQIILVCYTLVVFLAENILSTNLKIHFSRWGVEHYGILSVMNHSSLIYHLKLTSYIQIKNQKIKTLNVSSVMQNSPKMNEEKFGLSISAVLAHLDCTAAQNAEYMCDFYK